MNKQLRTFVGKHTRVWSRDHDRGPSGAKDTKRRAPGEPGKAAMHTMQPAGRSTNKLADPTGHASPPAEASLDARHTASRSSPQREIRKFVEFLHFLQIETSPIWLIREKNVGTSQEERKQVKIRDITDYYFWNAIK